MSICPNRFFQGFLQCREESPVFRRILHIEHQPRVVIAINCAFMFPNPTHNLAVPRKRAKSRFQLLNRLPQQRLRDCAAVLELKRKQNLVAPADAHAVAAGSPAAKALAVSYRWRMRSYVPAPSTENTMPSAAKCGRAGSGTRTSPVAQLLPEKRPSK